MMDYLSSMYIDNEMDLEEKEIFVEKIRSDKIFYMQTLDLLAQERLLEQLPLLPEYLPEQKRYFSFLPGLVRLLKPMGFTCAGFCTAALLFILFFHSPASSDKINRFVLFEPSAARVELTGSFTGWHRVAMQRIGNSGYWELKLPVNSGEHRFAYILDNSLRITDPTFLAKEKDDFGGENSILNVEERT